MPNKMVEKVRGSDEEKGRHNRIVRRMIHESGLANAVSRLSPDTVKGVKNNAMLADRMLSLMLARAKTDGIEKYTLKQLRDHRARIAALKGETNG